MGKKQHIDRIVESAIYLQSETRRLAKEQCALHGITATQLAVIKLLMEIGDLSLSELSKKMAARNSTITGIVDRMSNADLVRRARREDDGRVWMIQLTEKGKNIASQVDVAPWDLLRNSLSSLSQSEVNQLISLLGKIAAHVEQAACNGENNEAS